MISNFPNSGDGRWPLNALLTLAFLSSIFLNSQVGRAQPFITAVYGEKLNQDLTISQEEIDRWRASFAVDGSKIISDSVLRPEDFSSYLLYADAVRIKNMRITAARRGQPEPSTIRQPAPEKILPDIRLEDFPSYSAYAEAITEANRRSRDLFVAETRPFEYWAQNFSDFIDEVAAVWNRFSNWIYQIASDMSAAFRDTLGMLWVSEPGPASLRTQFEMSGSASEHLPETPFAYREGDDYLEIMERVTAAAELGDVTAQWFLGYEHLNGKLVESSPKAAFKWFTLAAEQGDLDAQVELGLLYLEGRGVQEDYLAAAKWLRAAADKGSARAQYELGMMYARAQNFEEDFETAASWIRLAAEQGLASAQHQLAMSYAFGIGMDKDDELALQWYLAAAEQEYSDSQYHLGKLYEEGLVGVDKDPIAASHFFTLAAEQGHPDAQESLGRMYFYGQGVEPDNQAAFMWYQSAAEQGVATAQMMLGIMYFSGGELPETDLWPHLGHEIFMPIDKARGYMWFLLAQENDYEGAKIALEMYEERMTYHELESATELMEHCRKSSYREC